MEKPEARLALEKRAVELGVKIPANIGDKKLQDRVDEAQAKLDAQTGKPPSNSPPENDASKAGGGDVTTPADKGEMDEEGRTPLLRVTGPREGFRRAGMKFTETPRDFFEGDLTDTQIKALVDEPKLAVTGFVPPIE